MWKLSYKSLNDKTMNRVLKNPNNVIFYFRNIFGSTIDLKKEKSRTLFSRKNDEIQFLILRFIFI